MSGHSAILTLTVAPPGTGKTVRRCAIYLGDEFLPNAFGVHWSNFPIKMDALCDYAKRWHKMEAEEVREVVRVIPQEVLDSWRDPDSSDGPWSFFGINYEVEPCEDYPEGLLSDEQPLGGSLAGVHLALDEAHLFIPSAGEMLEKRKAWRRWLREVRHAGATVELITQDIDGLDKQVVMIAERQLEISNETSGQLFWISNYDWFNLRSKFLGYWSYILTEREKVKVGRRWNQVRYTRHWSRPEYFALYDSWSAAQHGMGGKAARLLGVEREIRPYEQLSWPRLLRWFFRRNWYICTTAIIVVCFGAWLFFGGGVFTVGKAFASIPRFITGRVLGVAAADDVPAADVSSAVSLGGVVPGEAASVVEVAEDSGSEKDVLASLDLVMQEILQEVETTGDLVGVFEDAIVLDGGEYVHVGGTVQFGVHGGRQVVAVDYYARACQFADGGVLRLRGAAGRSSGRSSIVAARVSAAAVGSNRSSGEGERSNERGGAAGIDSSPGRPSVGFPAGPGATGRRDDRMGGRTGSGAGDSRGGGSIGRIGLGPVGASSGRADGSPR